MEPLKRVLVVDDEPYLRSFLKNLLEPYFAVETAAGGPEALALARDRPDAMLIDVLMPGMSGPELCRRLRDAGLTSPIIMLTALDEAATRDACRSAGADDLLCKPFHPDELVARLTRWLDA